MTASSAPSRTQRLRPSSTSRSSGPRLARAYCSSASSCSTGMFAVSRISMSYPLYMSQVVYLSQMTLADLTVIGQGEIRSDCRQTISSRHAWTQPDKITIPTIHMLPPDLAVPVRPLLTTRASTGHAEGRRDALDVEGWRLRAEPPPGSAIPHDFPSRPFWYCHASQAERGAAARDVVLIPAWDRDDPPCLAGPLLIQRDELLALGVTTRSQAERVSDALQREDDRRTGGPCGCLSGLSAAAQSGQKR